MTSLLKSGLISGGIGWTGIAVYHSQLTLAVHDCSSVDIGERDDGGQAAACHKAKHAIWALGSNSTVKQSLQRILCNVTAYNDRG
jgi:hypothetical protein